MYPWHTRFLPKLHTQRFWLESEKRWVSLKLSGNRMRTIDKKGVEVVMNELRAQGVKIGPEPLEAGFDVGYLADRACGRRVAIKQFLVDQRIVVGVGNIYASEALFRAGIHPRRATGRISRARFGQLVDGVQAVLGEAIRQGGTTLRNCWHREPRRRRSATVPELFAGEYRPVAARRARAPLLFEPEVPVLILASPAAVSATTSLPMSSGRSRQAIKARAIESAYRSAAGRAILHRNGLTQVRPYRSLGGDTDSAVPGQARDTVNQ